MRSDGSRRYRRGIDATARFSELVGRGSGLRLDEAALLIAAHARPGLDPEPSLVALDRLAETCVEPTFEGLLRHLFSGPSALRGNVVDYSDPDNSMLDQVLARRLGLPITLSIVAIEVARRLGVQVGAVGMPGHFLVTDLSRPGRFADPFHQGRILDEDGCRQVHAHILGPGEAWDPSFLDPIPPRAVIIRVLTNLKGTYAARNDVTNLRWVLRLRCAFPELEPTERRELARLVASTN